MTSHRLLSISLIGLCAFMAQITLAADNPIAPDGIRYVPATKAANSQAMNELQTVFSGSAGELTQLVSKGVEQNKKVLLGVYLSQILTYDPSYKDGTFAAGEYQVPLDREKGVIIHSKMLVIDQQDQIKAFTDLFTDTYRLTKPVTIRKLTKDEMALIWFYISWDLVEPIYVVEIGDTKLVFEFDPSGSSLEWIEDITQPCFSLAIGAGGLPCMCQVVVHKGNQYASDFRPMSECKTRKSDSKNQE